MPLLWQLCLLPASPPSAPGLKKKKIENRTSFGGRKRSQAHGSKDSFKGVVSFIPGKHEREGQSKIANPRFIDLREHHTGF